MPLIHTDSRNPMRTAKHWYGLTLVTTGVIVSAATLVWVAGYFVTRGLDSESLRLAFGAQFAHWAPVLIFCLPGLLLVFHGRRFMRDMTVSLSEFIESLAVLLATCAIGYLALG